MGNEADYQIERNIRNAETFPTRRHIMANARREALTTPTVRVSYAKLVEPQGYQGSTENRKYSMSLMFDKNNPEHMTALKKLLDDLQACLVEQFPDEATRPRIPLVAKTVADGYISPVRCGDGACNKNRIPIKEGNPEYAGHYIVPCTKREADGPPVVKGPNNQDIPAGSVKSGYWCNVNVNAFAYTGGSGGVSVGLNGVQLIREDETFGVAGPDPNSMFAAVGPDPSAYGGDLEGQAQSAAGGGEDWLGGGQPQQQQQQPPQQGGGSLI